MYLIMTVSISHSLLGFEDTIMTYIGYMARTVFAIIIFFSPTCPKAKFRKKKKSIYSSELLS